jgi:hypothetical protein
MDELNFMKRDVYIMAPEAISTALFINPSQQFVCLYVHPSCRCLAMAPCKASYFFVVFEMPSGSKELRHTPYFSYSVLTFRLLEGGKLSARIQMLPNVFVQQMAAVIWSNTVMVSNSTRPAV